MKRRSRADLVNALNQSSGLDPAKLASAFGFSQLAVNAPSEQDAVSDITVSRAGNPAQGTPILSKRFTQPRFWYVEQCETQAPVTSPENAAWPDLPEGFSPAQRQSKEPAVALRSAGQWQNLWDAALPLKRRGRRIDILETSRQLSCARPLRRLPRLPTQTFNRHVTLVLDRCYSLYPVWPDMHDARASLARLLGAASLDLYAFDSGPLGSCFRAGRGGAFDQVAAPVLRKDTLVVAVGAFGALESGRPSPDWASLFAQFRQDSHGVVLVPVCPIGQKGNAVFPLDPDAGVPGGHRASCVEALIAALTQTVCATRARVRDLRKSIPGANLYTELLAFTSKHLKRDDDLLAVRPSQLRRRLSDFDSLPRGVKAAIGAKVDGWQVHLGALEQETERLQRALLRSSVPDPKDYPAICHQAKVVGGDDALRVDTLAFVHLRTLGPICRDLVKCYPGLTDQQPGWWPILETVQRVAIAAQRTLPLADRGLEQGEVSQSITQASGDLALSAKAAVPTARVVLDVSARPFRVDTDQLVTGLLTSAGDQIDIVDRGRRYRLKALRKPHWADRIWRDADGLHAAHEQGAVFRLDEAGAERGAAHWRCLRNPWAWAETVGVNDGGLWVAMSLSGVEMRLRWIPPGRFVMGSPEDEVDREDDEVAHEVTLSRGFWLGETAVTQALWRAVVGKNPSRFSADPQNPVEQVSWTAAQAFVRRANEALGGSLSLRLPTEAEWEYACRAGSRTAFWWGDDLTSDRANFDGTMPYAGAEAGVYRGKPVPVYAFAPNDWGLYQMHGNVWEWCEDRYGEYAQQAVQDPKGPRNGRMRVLRGGSWFNGGRVLRSAQRNASAPGYRYDRFGLRLAGGSDPTGGRQSEARSADRWPRSGRKGGVQAPNGATGESGDA